MSKVINIFSTPLYLAKLSLNINEIQSYCYQCQAQDAGRKISNRKGWQSNFINLNDEVFLPLYDQINSHLNIYKKLIGVIGNVKLDKLWININPPGGSNVLHKHPGCLISGTVYIQTDSQTGEIYFENPNSVGYDWMPEFFKDSRWNKDCNEFFAFEPQNELILLFPSWAKHGVISNTSNKDRISISFNGKLS